jgi:hypothetical protein
MIKIRDCTVHHPQKMELAPVHLFTIRLLVHQVYRCPIYISTGGFVIHR